VLYATHEMFFQAKVVGIVVSTFDCRVSR